MVNHPPNHRARILEAAARVYGEHGFRGATTRRIATAAGVNEVTLFRLFGSKNALIDEAVRCHAANGERPSALPDRPGVPETELTSWALTVLQHLTRNATMIRKCMGEMEERPEMVPNACAGPTIATESLYSYVQKLRRAGQVTADGELRAAVSMLIGALFAEGMSRDMMPQNYPASIEKSATMYVRLFLRAIGFQPATPKRAIRKKPRIRVAA